MFLFALLFVVICMTILQYVNVGNSVHNLIYTLRMDKRMKWPDRVHALRTGQAVVNSILVKTNTRSFII